MCVYVYTYVLNIPLSAILRVSTHTFTRQSQPKAGARFSDWCFINGHISQFGSDQPFPGVQEGCTIPHRAGRCRSWLWKARGSQRCLAQQKFSSFKWQQLNSEARTELAALLGMGTEAQQPVGTGGGDMDEDKDRRLASQRPYLLYKFAQISG